MDWAIELIRLAFGTDVGMMSARFSLKKYISETTALG